MTLSQTAPVETLATSIALGDLYVKRQSVDPSKFSDEQFELFSVPSYERNTPDKVSGFEIGSSKVSVEQGDTLLCRIVPHIRRAWVVPKSDGLRQIASGEWIILRSPAVEPGYLKHVLLADPFHNRFMSTVAGVGGSLMRARPAQAADIRIPLPPLPEQRRIAAILDNAAELRTDRRRTLTLLEELGNAVFSLHLGRASGVRALAEDLEFLTSGSRGWAKYYSASGTPFLRIQNVGHDALLLDQLAYVNAPDNAEARRTTVREGDVLLSITADLGRTAVVSESLSGAFVNQHLAILRSRSLNSRFLARYLASPEGKAQLMKKNRAAVKDGLNFDDIRSVEVPIISPDDQMDLEKKLDAIDQLVEVQRAHLSCLEELIAAMHHRAFRGEL